MNESRLSAQLDGIFVPMFTPFTADGSGIDYDQLRRNVRYLVSQGIRLLNPAGTTGEFWTLTPEEHREVLRTVLDEARHLDPDVLVIAGTSCASLPMTLDLAQFATSAGAKVLQITPPYYLPSSDDDLVAYFREISENTEAGIMLYEMPVATGVTLRGAVLERICEECPRVIALKTAAPATAPREFERIVRQYGQRLRIFSATGAYYSTFTYLTGAAGITDTMSNMVPAFGLTLHRLARAGQWAEMNRIYQDAFDVLEIELLYGKGGLKEMANLCGLHVGPTRFPLVQSVTPVIREDIRRRLRAWSYTRPLIENRSATVPVAVG